jgi:hypothetical protein
MDNPVNGIKNMQAFALPRLPALRMCNWQSRRVGLTLSRVRGKTSPFPALIPPLCADDFRQNPGKSSGYL